MYNIHIFLWKDTGKVHFQTLLKETDQMKEIFLQITGAPKVSGQVWPTQKMAYSIFISAGLLEL